jgi:hypothetical protein
LVKQPTHPRGRLSGGEVLQDGKAVSLGLLLLGFPIWSGKLESLERSETSGDLIGGLEHFLFSIIDGIILPVD